MPLLLFIAFIVVPLVELWVILQVGGMIGTLPTIVLLVVDSLIGAWLVRREGRRAWRSLQQAFASGQWPADEVTQGALVIFGGALLLTPGFVTDVLGLLSVLPPTRAMMSSLLRRWTAVYASRRMGGSATFPEAGRTRGSGPSGRRGTSGPSGGVTRPRRPVNDPDATRPDSSSGDRGSGTDLPDVEVLGVERDDPDDA